MTSAPQPEFSHVVDLAELPRDGGTWELSATHGERAAIAERLGLLALDRLDAHIRLSWIIHPRTLHATGQFRARILQSCVVTLEPVPADIEAPVDILFTRDAKPAEPDVGWDAAEPLATDLLDIGDLVAEELSLNLDPYPRSSDIDPTSLGLGPGVTLSTDESHDMPEPVRNNPFGALENMKGKS